MPVDLFPDDQPAAGGGRHVLFGNAAAGYRSQHHGAAGALLHAGQRHRSYGVAFHSGRQHDPRVFPAQYQRRRRRDAAIQPGAGGSETPSAGHSAAGGAEIRRFEPAGMPGGGERRGSHRNPASRLRPVRHPQPDCDGARRIDPRHFRRKVPADHGSRRSVQAAVARSERHGRGQRGEQPESDSAGRRRKNGAVRLLHLLQQPGRQHGAAERRSAEDRRAIPGFG